MRDEKSGSCVPLVAAPKFCGEDTVPTPDGGCERAGVAFDGCGKGFVTDGHGGCEASLPKDPCTDLAMAVPGDAACEVVAPSAGAIICPAGFVVAPSGGCDPVLPKASCAPGAIALMGETTCREVASCGAGPYGDLPTGLPILYVDGSYGGGASDGSVARPFTTIQAAVDVARSDVPSVVAVAAGTYAEQVDVNKPVRLLGRCPAQVEIHGSDGTRPVVRLRAAGAAVERMAVTGTGIGIEAGALVVTIQSVRVYDTAGPGLAVLRDAKTTLRASLLERATDAGVSVVGGSATVEDSVIRDTRPRSDGLRGRGVDARSSVAPAQSSTLVVRRSLLQGNHELGLGIIGSNATIESSLVRDTLARSTDGTSGRGIAVEVDAAGVRSTADIKGCVWERNREVGIFLHGSSATVESSTIRDTATSGDGTLGRGIQAQTDAVSGERSALILRASVVVRNAEYGVYVRGSKGTIETTLVADTRPNAAGTLGRGIGVEDDPPSKTRGDLVLRSSRILGNRDVGLLVGGSNATIELTAVMDTASVTKDKTSGRGVVVQDDPKSGEPTEVTLRRALIGRNREVGLYVAGAKVTLEETVVRETGPRESDGTGGRGVVAEMDPTTKRPADVTLHSCLLERNRDFGAFASGGVLSLRATLVRDTLARASDDTFGRGLGAQVHPSTGSPSEITIEGSVIERSHELGLFAEGSTVTVISSVVRDSMPTGKQKSLGRGIHVQSEPTRGLRGNLLVQSSLIERTREAALYVLGSDAVIERTIVRNTESSADLRFAGGFGDGIVASGEGGAAKVTLRGVIVTGSTRAGAATFGATLAIERSRLLCSAFDLDREALGSTTPQLEDLGGNACGCPRDASSALDYSKLGDCSAATAGLERAPLPM